MVDNTLAQVGHNLSQAMRILDSSAMNPLTDGRRSRSSIPAPLQGDGQDVASILDLVHHLIHEEEEEEESVQTQGQQVGEQAHMALLGHSLAAYISVLPRDRLRSIATRILSDSTLWLCRLFRYENASAYFHEDDRDGLVRVCRLVLHARYEEYPSEGYGAFTSKQPVIYLSASCRPGLGQHLCGQLGLPLSSLCTVPCNTMFGSQHQMDVALLDKLVQEDLDSGKLPLLLIANAGTPAAGHTDKLSRLKELCDQNNMWLHVEGVNLATLALGNLSSPVMAAARSDSLTLTPGLWLGLPAVCAVTLYRHEDPVRSLSAGLMSSGPLEKLRALPLWLSLQYLGHSGIVQRIQHATALSQQLQQKLKSLTSIQTSVEDELSSPVVLFKFSPDRSSELSGGSVQSYCPTEKEVLHTFNRWLGQELARLVPSCGVDVVELEDEGFCVRFSPLLTAAVLGTQPEDVQRLVDTLTELIPLLSSTVALRQDFREQALRLRHTLTYLEERDWAGLGAVRYEPEPEGLDEEHRSHKGQHINRELLKRLQELDPDISFCSGPEESDTACVYVGMVSDDVDVVQLLDTIAAMGRDIDDSGRLLENMSEVVRRGIQEAEQQLQKSSEEKLMEEGVLRQLPIVGSVLNWFSPVQSAIKGQSFNLAAGSLDSTETTYSTRAQSGRTPAKDTPTSSATRQPGQKIFRRSGENTDSFSETSSAGQPEELRLNSNTPPVVSESALTESALTDHPHQDEGSSVQGESAADQGESAADQGESAADQGESAAVQGESAAVQGESAADQGESAADQGESAAVQGEAALTTADQQMEQRAR
ncbi:pyridoxal-dependent decarboxylase domain-containing protein 1 [Eucyclogobius newberryi]|uniref:pyridoxal-dependent decarboxylase domain-containing protein 1 n=1 Tax=Eucyclogobius newberryi TaxID=166745 RepID=UPI003B5A9C91